MRIEFKIAIGILLAMIIGSWMWVLDRFRQWLSLYGDMPKILITKNIELIILIPVIGTIIFTIILLFSIAYLYSQENV